MIDNRLELLIDTYCKGSKAEFAKRVGVAPSLVTNVTGIRKGAPSFEFLAKIAAAFPQINCRWLLTGEGDMAQNESKNKTQSNDDIDALKRLLKAQDIIIDLQRKNAELTETIKRLEGVEKKETTPIKRAY